MTPIETVALTAILGCAKAPAVDVVAERPRLEQLARHVSTAAISVDGGPFTGEARIEAAALALVAIAKHESEFSAKVQDCRRTGDTGRAITLYQLFRYSGWPEPERGELCGDGELAAHEALRVLGSNGRKAGSVGGLFAAYAGRRGVASEDTCRIWQKEARRAGLRASCSGGRAIAFDRGGS